MSNSSGPTTVETAVDRYDRPFVLEIYSRFLFLSRLPPRGREFTESKTNEDEYQITVLDQCTGGGSDVPSDHLYPLVSNGDGLEAHKILQKTTGHYLLWVEFDVIRFFL